jgi:DNA-binding protein Fis
MHKPLRAMISDAVVQYVTYKLHAKEPVDVALIAGEITLSLLDLVMEQDETHQAALIAHIVGTLGGEYLEKRGLFETTRRDN